MNYLYFGITFLWCCFCICCTFLFCSRVLFVQKVEKLDPVNAVKTQKGIKKATVQKHIEYEEKLNKLLENG